MIEAVFRSHRWPGHEAAVAAQAGTIAQGRAGFSGRFWTQTRPQLLGMIGGPQTDGVAVVEQLPPAGQMFLHVLLQAPQPSLRPSAHPARQITSIHEIAGPLRLHAVLV